MSEFAAFSGIALFLVIFPLWEIINKNSIMRQVLDNHKLDSSFVTAEIFIGVFGTLPNTILYVYSWLLHSSGPLIIRGFENKAGEALTLSTAETVVWTIIVVASILQHAYAAYVYSKENSKEPEYNSEIERFKNGITELESIDEPAMYSALGIDKPAAVEPPKEPESKELRVLKPENMTLKVL